MWTLCLERKLALRKNGATVQRSHWLNEHFFLEFDVGVSFDRGQSCNFQSLDVLNDKRMILKLEGLFLSMCCNMFQVVRLHVPQLHRGNTWHCNYKEDDFRFVQCSRGRHIQQIKIMKIKIAITLISMNLIEKVTKKFHVLKNLMV